MDEQSDLSICNVLCSWDKVVTVEDVKESNAETKDCQNVDLEIEENSLFKNNLLVSKKNIQEYCKNKTFTCSTCFKDLSSRNSLRVHLKMHSGEKPFCCEHCGKLFSHYATLVGHLKKFHNINGETAHKCSICNKIFCRKNALKIHMATHAGFKPFPCKICSKTFSQKITRDIHTLSHTGKYDYTCSECSRKFPTRYKLNYHMKIHNLPEFHCLLCLKQFTNKEDLDAHCGSHNATSETNENNEQYNNVNFTATNTLYPCESLFNTIDNPVDDGSRYIKINQTANLEKKFLCNFCGCNFPERRSLLHHIKMRHAVVPAIRHSCFMCQKSFSQKSKLNFHIKRHTELPNYRCEICGKRYYRKDSLEKHNKIHEKTITTCTICEKKLKTENDLQKHMILHTSLDYTCLQCGKTFTTKSAHKFHNDMHNGKYQFICNYCGKKFVRKCHYEEHIKIHTVINKINCTLCHKQFREKKLLNRHMKRCHSNSNQMIVEDIISL